MSAISDPITHPLCEWPNFQNARELRVKIHKRKRNKHLCPYTLTHAQRTRLSTIKKSQSFTSGEEKRLTHFPILNSDAACRLLISILCVPSPLLSFLLWLVVRLVLLVVGRRTHCVSCVCVLVPTEKLRVCIECTFLNGITWCAMFVRPSQLLLLQNNINENALLQSHNTLLPQQ